MSYIFVIGIFLFTVSPWKFWYFYSKENFNGCGNNFPDPVTNAGSISGRQAGSYSYSIIRIRCRRRINLSCDRKSTGSAVSFHLLPVKLSSAMQAKIFSRSLPSSFNCGVEMKKSGGWGEGWGMGGGERRDEEHFNFFLLRWVGGPITRLLPW